MQSVGWQVHLAHGTESGTEPVDLLCSRNARGLVCLVGETERATGGKGETGNSLSGLSGLSGSSG